MTDGNRDFYSSVLFFLVDIGCAMDFIIRLTGG